MSFFAVGQEVPSHVQPFRKVKRKVELFCAFFHLVEPEALYLNAEDLWKALKPERLGRWHRPTARKFELVDRAAHVRAQRAVQFCRRHVDNDFSNHDLLGRGRHNGRRFCRRACSLNDATTTSDRLDTLFADTIKQLLDVDIAVRPGLKREFHGVDNGLKELSDVMLRVLLRRTTF